MAVAALVLFVVMMLLAGGLRTLLQRRRTGDTGNRRNWADRGSTEWWGLALAELGYLTVGIAAPAAAFSGLPPIAALDHPAAHITGVVIAITGILATFGAQLAMGSSWRIGVDETERTALVTTGPFRLIRNPIFTAAAAVFLGLTMMVPNAIALVGLICTITGIQIQVRLVEEPHLRRIHGTAYTDYASRAGRFLPGLGRLPAERHPRAET
ncbi:methyltransferase family protein [Pseudarthrobacter sp. NPDC092184]|uniref:methyltransferase family protein n=1 Tax=Pseudarthrobacter TaxID=1742993 RepID=UPI0035EAD644|nr:isoprenylcysteine carboxylmethyltransferase family protein [Pseudarthrobacter oxydans]